MKKVLLVAVMVALVGCDQVNPASDSRDWNRQSDHSLVDYHCDDKQMAAMEKSYTICKDSSYLNSFCFKQAKISQCSYIGANPSTETSGDIDK